MPTVTIRIAGPAGYGAKSIGLLMQKALRDMGYHTFGYMGYPSLIRGGENFYQLTVSTKPINATFSKFEIFIPLTRDAYDTYKHLLARRSLVVFNAESVGLIPSRLGGKNIGINVFSALKQKGLPTITQNVFFIGAVFTILGLDLSSVEKTLKKFFASKGEKVVSQNIQAFKLGAASVKDSLDDRFDLPKPRSKDRNLIISGNEAIALGFIKAGGTFYSTYPMTPSTNILHFLAKHGPDNGVIVRQASTEIEAIGVAAGASFAGARAMVGTSGGGLDLMGEFISMLGITEVPLVIVDAQRVGPGTGLPTWTEQSDLNLAKNIGHGEFPRIVLAPGDPAEAYEMIQHALNLAEVWQVPVIFLSDKYLSESFFSVAYDKLNSIKVRVDRGKILRKVKGNFLRYKFDKLGVSYRTLPGTPGGLHVVNSDDHDEYGNSIESDPIRPLMQSKRLVKLKHIARSLPGPAVYGKKQAKRAVVAWGSMKWPAIYLAERLTEQTGKPWAAVHFTYMYPLDYPRISKQLSRFSEVYLIENNSTAQLKADLEKMGLKVVKTFLKFDGEPFFIDEIN